MTTTDKRETVHGREIGDLLISWDDDREYEFDDMIEELEDVLTKKNPTGHWHGEMKSFGLMKKDGYKNFYSIDGIRFLSAILPDTDCRFKIFDYGKGIAIQNWHHDSPTGNEWYFVVPATEEEEEE